MPLDPHRSASHLFQRPNEEKRALARMRGKLASSGRPASARPVLGVNPAARSFRYRPWVVGAAMLLAGFNYALIAHTDRILSALGVASPATRELVPPAGLTLDDQARFWAYAAYDIPKLRARFGARKGLVVQSEAARKHLERLLAGDLGTEVRNEIFALQKRPIRPPASPKPR